MLLGYNTNGLAHHDPIQAVELLAAIGYKSIAITLDQGTLNPFSRDLAESIATMRDALQRLEMRSVIETGARFLLDPNVKHEPTLMSTDPDARARRVDFLCRAIDIARELGSDCVSFWSGILRDDADDRAAMQRLVESLRQVIDYGAGQGSVLAFEPEPGMFIDTMAGYKRLLEHVDAPHFRLTLDVGHLHCQRETPIADYIRQWRTRIANIHIEDMRAGVHEHLMFGEGEMDFPPIIEALAGIGYEGGVHVELSRHSHVGPAAARRAFAFLQPLMTRET